MAIFLSSKILGHTDCSSASVLDAPVGFRYARNLGRFLGWALWEELVQPFGVYAALLCELADAWPVTALGVDFAHEADHAPVIVVKIRQALVHGDGAGNRLVPFLAMQQITFSVHFERFPGDNLGWHGVVSYLVRARL